MVILNLAHLAAQLGAGEPSSRLTIKNYSEKQHSMPLYMKISTLTQEEASEHYKTLGLLAVGTAQFISTVFTNRKRQELIASHLQANEAKNSGFQAEETAFEGAEQWRGARRRAAEALERGVIQQAWGLANLDFHQVQQTHVYIIDGALNSSGDFLDGFTSSAVLLLDLQVQKGNDALEKINSHIDVHEELPIHNADTTLKSKADGFSRFIHHFILSEIEKIQTEDREHWFYVFNTETDWHESFKNLNKDGPGGLGQLPANFCGFSADLEALFLLMWSNRKHLCKNFRNGNDVQFHLIIPTLEYTLFEKKLSINPEIFPLVITGPRHKSNNLVWFNFPLQQSFEINHIGNIAEMEEQEIITLPIADLPPLPEFSSWLNGDDHEYTRDMGISRSIRHMLAYADHLRVVDFFGPDVYTLIRSFSKGGTERLRVLGIPFICYKE